MNTHIHTRLVMAAMRGFLRCEHCPGGAHLQAVLYIRLNKAPPVAVQQRRLIARSLDEVRTKGSIQSSHLPRCHVGQSDTGARRSPLFLGLVFAPSPLLTRLRSLTRRDGDWGGLLLCLLSTVSFLCVWGSFWSDLSHCPAAPCLGPMRSLYVWLGSVSAEVADSFSPAVNHPSFLNVTTPLPPCAPMF